MMLRTSRLDVMKIVKVVAGASRWTPLEEYGTVASAAGKKMRAGANRSWKLGWTGNDGKGLTGVHHTTGRSRRVVPVWSPRTPHAAAAPWSHPLDLHLLHRRADGLSALLSWPRTSGATVVGVGGKRRRRDDVD